MTDPIPSAGETTIIGLPAITVPVTSTGDRPLTKEDLNTIMRLADGTALLFSTRGAVSGSRYLLDEDEITVGRDPSSDILLDDSTVSRTHAVFRRINGNYSVIDAGSLNGTYVNRQRVDSQELKNGDEIILGKFRLVYFTNKAVIA
ncbi:FHA domain-containing protein [Bifidobacterium adolescentis]|uniref:FHA domain-containing protein n=1 Tax=Bifidobacterium adolescentis TaxID=1680 RepID=UPI000E44D44E|nr:FHA domain-containing protein [Bifidobacterium adolescentis]RGL58427.1 FHA domain-containing protein [Bifidobacterium adolescentis]